MSLPSLLLSLTIAQATEPLPPPATPVVDLAPTALRPQALKPMIARPIGNERVFDDADHGERWAIERTRLGPDGARRQILGLPKLLRPLEQRFEDTTALSECLRINESYGMPYPMSFERVYDAPDQSGQLVRGNGACYLTYPYGTYMKLQVKKGGKKTTILLPSIPPGATFHIGMPRAWMAQPPQEPQAHYSTPMRVQARLEASVQQRLDTRLVLGPRDPATAQISPLVVASAPRRDADEKLADAETMTLPRIAVDEDYRRSFFQSLCHQRDAAKVEDSTSPCLTPATTSAAPTALAPLSEAPAEAGSTRRTHGQT